MTRKWTLVYNPSLNFPQNRLNLTEFDFRCARISILNNPDISNFHPEVPDFFIHQYHPLHSGYMGLVEAHCVKCEIEKYENSVIFLSGISSPRNENPMDRSPDHVIQLKKRVSSILELAFLNVQKP